MPDGDPADRSACVPRIIDARGMRCPWPVLRTAKAMREGAAFTVIADDPIARTDIPALAKATGWQCNIVETAGETRFILHRDAAIGCPIS